MKSNTTDGLPTVYTDSRGRTLAINDPERFNSYHLSNKLNQLVKRQAENQATEEDILLMQALQAEQDRRGGPPTE